MRVGVLVIGSLLWERTQDRVDWRTKRLLPDLRTRVRVPIRYGRISKKDRGGCYTMILEGSRPDRLGSAWVVPAKHEASSVDDLINEARRLATAERMRDGTCMKWAIIGLWIRAGVLKPEELAKWRDGIATSKAYLRDLQSRCPLTQDALIRLPWPEFVDADRADDFDALLAAVTDPTPDEVDGPRPSAVVRKMREDVTPTGRGYEYFVENRRVGITTFQDLAILDEIRKDAILSRRDPSVPEEDRGEVWEYVERFVGYGPAAPRFVFLGLEERADARDEERNLRARLARPDIFGGSRGDKNDALTALYASKRANDVPQWTIAGSILAEIRKLLGEQAVDNELVALGTEKGDAFLGELLPIPRQSRSKFPSRFFGLTGDTAYCRKSIGRNAGGSLNRTDTPLTKRWRAMESLLHGPPAPEFIVCYGRTCRTVWDQLVRPWSGEPEREVEGGKIYKIGTTSSGSAAAITGFFRERARHRTDITRADVAMIARRLVATAARVRQ